jgi:hypothetical protein
VKFTLTVSIPEDTVKAGTVADALYFIGKEYDFGGNEEGITENGAAWSIDFEGK